MSASVGEREKLLRESATEAVEESVLAHPPTWSDFLSPGAAMNLLTSLHGADTAKQVQLLQGGGMQAYHEALKAALNKRASSALVYLLTLLGEIARSDSSVLSGADFSETLQACLAAGLPAAGADRAAYLLTTSPKADGLEAMTAKLVGGSLGLSDQGVLDALTNLLKQPDLREAVWAQPGVQSKVLSFGPESPPPVVYKSLFALWMVSCAPELFDELKQLGVVAQIKKTLQGCRTEKVVRVGLLALKNFLADAGMAEEVVEAQTLDAVEALEYEKWRDAEVYDGIKQVAKSCATAQSKHSNFARYEKELAKDTLTKSFLHSEKFWAENYLHFEKDQFRAIKKLVDLASTSKDPETLAVACHDLGEFARLHPQGKLVLAKFPRAKATAMQCMQHEDREVAREALLCVQKLMLNRWQDCADGKAAAAA